MHHLSKYTWIFVITAILLGFVWPTPGILIKPAVSILLIGLMTLSFIKIKTADIIRAFTHARIYIIVLITLLITPLLAFLAKPFLAPEIFAGLIIATAVPAGVSVVFICTLCHGKPVDALNITALSHIISTITLPLLIWLAGQEAHIQPSTLLFVLIKFIFLPLILAQVVSPVIEQRKALNFTLSTLLLIAIIWAIIAPTRAFIMAYPAQTVTVLLISGTCMLLPFALGWIIGRSPSEKITYSIAASYKNYALATVIAYSLLGEIGTLAPIAYTILNNILFAIVQERFG
ncbi:hypothetical protein HY489_06540 [Candidatus Woesearchaeota archaeon]|nr:hypothetical protein [Candidatus Woesearchaeota archaeon]